MAKTAANGVVCTDEVILNLAGNKMRWRLLDNVPQHWFFAGWQSVFESYTLACGHTITREQLTELINSKLLTNLRAN